MRVGAFIYVRNGIKLGYPFIESIRSILHYVHDIVVLVGDSDDGTREAVKAIHTNKLRIVDTVWDQASIDDSTIYDKQVNLGILASDPGANMLIHLQADEVLHEKDIPHLDMMMKHTYYRKDVDAIILPVFHFYGDYKHIAPSRRQTQWQIRVIKNHTFIGSADKGKSFRWFLDEDNPNDKGKLLRCRAARAFIYDYSGLMKSKQPKGIDINTQIDFLRPFPSSHPRVMENRIAQQDWTFEYDPSKNNMTKTEKMLKFFDDHLNIQPFLKKDYKRNNRSLEWFW